MSVSTETDTAGQGDDNAPWHVVKIHWPDGTSHIDEIRGWGRDDAVARAEWNWGTANPYGRCERVEYLHPEAWTECCIRQPDDESNVDQEPCLVPVEHDDDIDLDGDGA